jgi:hypothetical protein
MVMTFFSQIPYEHGRPTHDPMANTPSNILRQMHATAAGMMTGGPMGGLPQADLLQMAHAVHNHLTKLLATDPRQYHAIAKQFGLPPYGGSGGIATSEFPGPGTEAPAGGR